MDDSIEARRERLAALLDHSAELTQRTEEMLSEPRPVMTYEPPQPNRYRGYAVETLDETLKATEGRLNKRIDALEARFQGLWQGVEGLADEAGKATGELEKKLRDEMRKETEALRGEMTLLRAQANTPARRHKPTVSRAPFSLGEDHAFKN